MDDERRQNTLEALFAQMAVLSEDTKTIKHFITGNGDPSMGLLFQVAQHKQYFSTLTKVIAALSVIGLGELGFVIHTLITAAYAQ